MQFETQLDEGTLELHSKQDFDAIQKDGFPSTFKNIMLNAIRRKFNPSGGLPIILGRVWTRIERKIARAVGSTLTLEASEVDFLKMILFDEKLQGDPVEMRFLISYVDALEEGLRQERDPENAHVQ